jgi:hypothetical protein
MSLHLYSIDYPDQFQPAHLQALLDRLPVAMQEKILRYRRWQDAYGSLLGKLLLETAMKKAGLPGDLNGLGVSAYGRPCWANGLDFNISYFSFRHQGGLRAESARTGGYRSGIVCRSFDRRLSVTVHGTGMGRYHRVADTTVDLLSLLDGQGKPDKGRWKRTADPSC